MYHLDRPRRDFLDQDAAVRRVLDMTDRGLFDADEVPDEELDPLSGRVSRAPARRRSPT